ncbi:MULTISPECIES: ABC transporter permease [Stenotrophomonas]|uniref:ABC transporter permease n=1 Tax=Stenotrophomonas TaxID=40323 RepID=UPI0022EA3494|nr:MULTISPECIES: ABC transporter permease [Stenotrophomonas]MDA3308112.1 ABC transporter permease [Stenotrophomonas sp. PI_27]WGS57360.1 ABC transporter permease [Stenotrophomonas pavanii]
MSNVMSMMMDARRSWRELLRRPTYLVLAGTTLALGIATITMVLALLEQAVLRPLPFPGSASLVTVGILDESGVMTVGSPGLYNQARQMTSLQATGLVQGFTRNMNTVSADVPEVLKSLAADRGFLGTLEVAPALGRNFTDSEDRVNGARAVIIGHDLWQRRFAGSQDVLTRTLSIEGEQVPIVGVLPATFVWPDPFDVLLPLRHDPTSSSMAANEYIIGRLASGHSLKEASAEADTRMRAFATSMARSKGERLQLERTRFTASSLKDSVFVSRSGNVPLMFLGVALCVLLIAITNLTNLMLLRASTHAHEAAVRIALGASTRHLLMPQISEAVLIGFIGGIVGLLAGWFGLILLAPHIPLEWTQGNLTRPGVLTIGSTFAIAQIGAVTAAVIGFFRFDRRRPVIELNASRGGISRGAGRFARILIAVQIAVAVLLLLTAALFGRSLQQLAAVPMGFESRSIVTFSLSPLVRDQPDITAVLAQGRRILDAVQQRAGVTSAAISTNLPTGSQFNMGIELPTGRTISSQYRPITDGFFTVFSIPLLAGRSFDDAQERADSPRTCVISQAFAKAYLSGNPVGQQITVPGDNGNVVMRIVGVVGDVRQFGPAQPVPPLVYVPLAQVDADLWLMIRDFMPLQYAVRLRGADENELAQSLPALVASVSNQQPISNVVRMNEVVRSTTSEQRLNLLLVAVFSALALLLASVGLYAVLAYSIAARSHEFGMRSALGASPRQLLLQVLRESGRQLAWGLLIGLAASMAASRLIQSFLFQTHAADLLSIVVVVVALTIAWLLASIAPARRAGRADPMKMLRQN